MFKTIENPGREDEDEDGEGEGDGDEEKDSLTAPAVNRSAFTSPA